MAALPWMLFQAGLTGYFLYRDTIEAQALGRAPEPLPVFILSTLGALVVAALCIGLTDVFRTRRPAAAAPPAAIAAPPVRRRKGKGSAG